MKLADMPTGKTVLKDFNLDRVALTAPYHANAFEKEIAYLTSYDADRLLAGFRETAGLAPKAGKYPGWESTEIRGHTMGHYLTACAQAYTQNKNAVLLAAMTYIVRELAECQQESGYVSAFPETLFDNVENRKPAWVPWYTMHKIIAGLIAVYRATGLQTAYDVANRLGDWAAERTSRWSEELKATVLAVEYGGMNDCLYDLYKLTGCERHLKAAHQFDEIDLFDAFRQGKDMLKGKHANTTIPKFLGALNRYLTLGESESFYLEATIRFWDIVVLHHSYITGGNSESEHFGEPDMLNGKRTDITCETCNSYNMLKLTRELFKLTQDIKYADFYETNVVNAILSSQNPDTGMTMYFQPMATGYFKVYGSPFEHFWCCTGTGMESFTKLNDSVYFHADDRLYINQYVQSELEWTEQNVRVIQTTELPLTDTVQLRIEMAGQEERRLSLCLRVPNWTAGELEMTINREPAAPAVDRDYAVIERAWRSGDTVDIRIPMKADYSVLPDAPNVVGFRYGPVVLSAALGTEDMTESRTGVIVSVPTKRMPVKEFIIPKGMSVPEWFADFNDHFVRKDGELAFVLKNTDEDERLLFTPHYKQHRERYGIYWSFVEAESNELLRHQEKVAYDQRLKEATIDSIQAGNDQYELEHRIEGELTYSGTWEGLNGRRADAGGCFGYEMKVLPEQRNGLAVTFSLLHRNSSLEIWVDDRLLAVESFPHHRRRAFYEKTFEIPAEFIQIQNAVRVKFVPKETLNGIYGMLRTIRLDDAKPSDR